MLSAQTSYTDNEISEKEIKKTTPFMIATKRIKIPRSKLNKVKDLHTENYKTLLKEIEEGTKKWKMCSWIGRINIVKMAILPKAIYTFNGIPVKIPMAFFKEIKQKFLKFMWTTEDPK